MAALATAVPIPLPTAQTLAVLPTAHTPAVFIGERAKRARHS